MYNKSFKVKIKLTLGLVLCAIAVVTAPVASITTYAADSSDVETCAHIKEWVYKIMDGKLYKALYNASTGLYETDWIYLCDWPPEE